VTPEQIALVQASAGRLAPDLGAVSHDFYGRLFAAYPEVRDMFPSDVSGQEKKFGDSVAAIVEAIPDFPAFSEKAAALGRVHARHHVSADLYPEVAGVLLEALEAADPEWDEPTRQAWATAYDLLAESMLMGGRARG
jgi:hemoglobin-like flavoprotein